ncbi:hypothetical protein C8Q70DRAFT_1031908 [Cubamyces menziesii]|nr:hypothetical protein C8Q70DRAFT_1031908 [Cubamyces menziesii]
MKYFSWVAEAFMGFLLASDPCAAASLSCMRIGTSPRRFSEKESKTCHSKQRDRPSQPIRGKATSAPRCRMHRSLGRGEPVDSHVPVHNIAWVFRSWKPMLYGPEPRWPLGPAKR